MANKADTGKVLLLASAAAAGFYLLTRALGEAVKKPPAHKEPTPGLGHPVTEPEPTPGPTPGPGFFTPHVIGKPSLIINPRQTRQEAEPIP